MWFWSHRKPQEGTTILHRMCAISTFFVKKKSCTIKWRRRHEIDIHSSGLRFRECNTRKLENIVISKHPLWFYPMHSKKQWSVLQRLLMGQFLTKPKYCTIILSTLKNPWETLNLQERKTLQAMKLIASHKGQEIGSNFMAFNFRRTLVLSLLVITMNSKYTQVSLLQPPQNLDHKRSYWFEFTRSNPVTNQTCSRQLWTSSPKHKMAEIFLWQKTW